MKYIILIILAFFLFRCDSQSEKSNENELRSTEINSQVGIDFLNSYIENCNQMQGSTDVVEWTRSSKVATDKFKTELENLVVNARKENPELGLGFDPIFDAQDYLDEGIRLFEFDAETGFLTVKGINWESFKVTMRLISQDGQTKVDGCGIINIPKDKSTSR